MTGTDIGVGKTPVSPALPGLAGWVAAASTPGLSTSRPPSPRSAPRSTRPASARWRRSARRTSAPWPATSTSRDPRDAAGGPQIFVNTAILSFVQLL